MKYKKLKLRHDKLEQDVLEALKKEVLKSKTESKHVQSKCIHVNVFNFKELVLINDTTLSFLNSDGYHYSLYYECSLEDLVDILNKI